MEEKENKSMGDKVFKITIAVVLIGLAIWGIVAIILNTIEYNNLPPTYSMKIFDDDWNEIEQGTNLTYLEREYDGEVNFVNMIVYQDNEEFFKYDYKNANDSIYSNSDMLLDDFEIHIEEDRIYSMSGLPVEQGMYRCYIQYWATGRISQSIILTIN